MVFRIKISAESEHDKNDVPKMSVSPFLLVRKGIADGVAELAVEDQYRQFITRFGDKRKGKEVVADKEVEKNFREILDFEVDVPRKSKNLKQYSALKRALRDKLVASLGVDDQAFVQNYVASVVNQRDIVISKRIMALKDSNPVLVDKFYGKRRDLEIKHSKGEIGELDYYKEREKINAEAVNESGDKDLQKQLAEYENDQPTISINDISIALNSNEEPVRDGKELNSAFENMTESGMNFSINSDGSASVMVGGEFPVDVFVSKNIKTGEFSFSIRDKYAKEGLTRSNSADFLLALDRRHIDAYISKGIGLLPDESTSIADIPDKDLVFIGEKLLGSNAKRRGYRIEGAGRKVLDALIVVLKSHDDKFPSLGKRVEILKNFLESEHNVDLVVRKLRSGKFKALSELIED